MKDRGSLRRGAAQLLKGAMIAVALLSLALPTASQDNVRRVGMLSGGTRVQTPGMQSTWRSGVLLSLDRNGFRVGENLELVDRYAEGNLERLPDLARKSRSPMSMSSWLLPMRRSGQCWRSPR